MRHFRWALVVLALTLFTASLAIADSVSFIPPSTTDPLHPYYFVGSSATFGAFTVTAWTYNGGWTQSTLDGRNDSTAEISDNDHGVGVCSQGPQGCTNVGNVNEIDSINGELEMIQVGLTSGDNTNWNGVVLSSMDQNGKSDFSDYVIASIYAGDGTPGAVSDPSTFASLLCSVNYSSVTAGSKCFSPPNYGSYLKFDVPYTFTSPVNAKYLYIFVPLRSDTATTGDINDFLVRGVTADVPTPPVPEPSSLMLLATGLGAASLAAKKFRG